MPETGDKTKYISYYTIITLSDMMLIEIGGKGHLEKNSQDFTGGTVDRNPPANAGDTCSIPGPEGFHMQQSNWAGVPQLPSLLSRVPEPKLLNLCCSYSVT